MPGAAQVAEDFFDAWTSKDYERARTLVHDDVSFEGPIDSFAGDDVCVIYDLKTAPVPSTLTCEWYRVRDGKVASVSVIFDARPFAPLPEGHGD